MNKRTISILLVAICGICVVSDLTAAKKKTTSGNVTIPADHLGDHWCLLTGGKTRLQIREALVDPTSTDWTAFAAASGGTATSCDAGIQFEPPDPKAKCMPTPASELTDETARLSVKSAGLTGVFNVTLKHMDGSPYAELSGGTGSFQAKASPGAINGKARWLSSTTPVSWAGSSGTTTYDIFIYLTDSPGVNGDIEQKHRIEFFDRNIAACTAEEPDNVGQVSSALSKIQDTCSSRFPMTAHIMEAPIGDGHHPPAQSGSCQY